MTFDWGMNHCHRPVEKDPLITQARWLQIHDLTSSLRKICQVPVYTFRHPMEGVKARSEKLQEIFRNASGDQGVCNISRMRMTLGECVSTCFPSLRHCARGGGRLVWIFMLYSVEVLIDRQTEHLRFLHEHEDGAQTLACFVCSSIISEITWKKYVYQGGKVNILGGHSMVFLTKKFNTYMCPMLNRFRDIFHCTVPKLLIRKWYYVLFLIPVFTVQVTKLVEFI
jgi:hypothetical protein